MYFRTRFIILNPISKRGHEIIFAQRSDHQGEVKLRRGGVVQNIFHITFILIRILINPMNDF